MLARLRKIGVVPRVALVGLLATLLVAAALVVATQAIDDLRGASRVAQADAQRILLATEVERRVIDIETGLRAYSITRERRFLEPRDRAVEVLPQLQRELRQLDAVTQGPATTTLPAIAAALRAYMSGYVDPLVAQIAADPGAGRSTPVLMDGKRRVDALRGMLSQLQSEARTEGQASQARADVSAARAERIGTAGLLIVPLAMCGLVLLLLRGVARPLRQLATVARRLREGDLLVTAREQGPGEVRELVGAFNAMTVSIRESRDELELQNTELEAQQAELELAVTELSDEREARRRFHDFVARLTGETDLQRLATTLLEQFTVAGEANAGVFYALEPGAAPDACTLTLLTSQGFDPDTLDSTVRPDVGLAGKALARREPVTVAHGEHGPELLAFGRPIGVRHELHVPLVHGDRVLGVLSLARLGEAAFSSADVEPLVRMAGPAAVTLAGALAAEATDRALRLYEATLAASRDAYLAVDRVGLVVAWSDRATEIFGYDEAAMTGRTLAELLLAPEERAAHHERRRKLMAEGANVSPAYRVWITDGQGRRVLLEIQAAVTQTAWRPICVYFVRDVTADSERAADLRAKEAVGRALAQAGGEDADLVGAALAAVGTSLGWSRGAYWTHDEPTDTLRCARQWADDSVVSGEAEALARLVSVPLEGHGDAVSLLARAWHAQRAEWEVLEPAAPAAPVGAGEAREAASSAGVLGLLAVPVCADGHPIGLLTFGLPDAHAPSPERLTALRGMADLFAQVDERHRAERAAERLKDEFFGLVSHELRTPLTSLTGYVDLVRLEEVGPLNAEERQCLDIAERNARRLNRLVGDLLFGAQVESGTLSLQLAPMSLGDVVEDAVEAARPQAAGAAVTVRGEIEPLELPDGDHDRLGQLVDNLVSNALKFTPAGGEVVVSLRRLGTQAVIEVRDTGCGIAAGDLARMFDRFYRTEDSRRDHVAGLGLGLSICQAIAEGHGGSIRARSEPGCGTTLEVRLPLGVNALPAGRAVFLNHSS